jgi:hypothetical protein
VHNQDHPRHAETLRTDKHTSYKRKWRGRKVWVKLASDRLPYEGIIVSVSQPEQVGRYNVIIRLSPFIVMAVRHVSRGREWDFVEE